MTDCPAPVLHAGFSSPGAPATPWSAVEEVLDRAEMFWISTVRADGSPHVCPLPAMWLDGALYFVTGWDEQKAVNLARNPRCALTTGNDRYRTGLDVVVEGRAERSPTARPSSAWRRCGNRDWTGRTPWMTRGSGTTPAATRRTWTGRGPGLPGAARPRSCRSRAGEQFAQTRYRP